MVTIFIIDDPNPIAEGPESFTLHMAISDTTETVDIPDEATVTILDNDTLIMSIEDMSGTTGNISVNENVGDAFVCIIFNIAYDEEFEIQAASFTLTATPNVDYERIDRTLTATTTDMADTGRCFPFRIVNDIYVEDDETFSAAIFLTQVPSFNFEFSSTTLIYTIIDDDNATLSIDQITVEENAGHANVMVTADRRIENTFTVSVSTLDGTAVMGLDYGALTNEPLTFPKLNTGSGATRTIMVPIVDDLIMESTETFLVSFTHLEDTSISRRIALPNLITVTVSDDDVTTIGIILDPAILTVDEGANSTYTVALNTQPTSEVTVTIGSDGDVSVTPTALTFTTTDWNTSQLVTVSATQDDDAFNDTATLAHNAQGGGYDSVTANLDVTVNDDDTAEITLSVTTLTVNEGSTNSYTVVLNTLPITDVTVTISSDGDVSAVTPVLTFTMTDWNIQQTVIVTATQEDDNALNDNATLSHNATGGGYNSVLKNLAVTIIDDDTADFTFNPTMLTVTEGSNRNYTITPTLLATDRGRLLLNISSSDDSIMLSQTSDDFKVESGRYRPIRVTVDAPHDDDAADKEVTLTHMPTDLDNNGYNSVLKDFVITIMDDDIAGFTFNPPMLTVGEGSTAVYTVVLDTQPTNDVTIAISSDGDVSATPTTLTFTTTDWGTPQTVTVNAARDDNAVDDSATLTHTAAGGDYEGLTADLAVTIIDSADITFDPAILTVDEDTTDVYTVVLNTQPTDEVTITISSDGDVSVQTPTLDFTTSNWDIPQTVRVSAAHDDDAVIDNVVLQHTAAGGDYDSLTANLEVIVIDDDTAGISFNPATVTVNEEDNADYTVRLDTQPTADVIVGILSDNTEVTVVPSASLTFTPDNWSTPQTITVAAAHDDDAVDDIVVLQHTAAGADYDSLTTNLEVIVIDDDTTGISFNPATVTVNEEDNADYTVRLDTEPIADVIVGILSDNTEVTVSSASLTFTPDNWSTPQTITVAAAHDDDAVDDSAILTHTATGGDYDSLTANLEVMVMDDDGAGINFDPAILTVDEGANSTYTVALNIQPTSEVTVTIGSDGDVSATPTTLTFTTTDWDTPQTVTVNAAPDDDGVIDNVVLQHTAAGGDYDSLTANLEVIVIDDDTAGISFNPATVTVNEEDNADYTVRLDTQPTADVIVGILSDNTEVTVVPSASLTFTPDNWSAPQTITVAAAHDDDAVDDIVVLQHTAAGGDYDSLTTNLEVIVIDDDTTGISFNPATITVNEEDNADYTVRLDTEPIADVIVGILSDNTEVTVSSASLTFTPDNWSTPQTITVVAAHDDDAVDDIVVLQHTAAGGDYDSLTANLEVMVMDDDAPGITFDPAILTVDEGANSTYTVALNIQPTSEVTVTIGSDGDVSATPTALTFTTTDWDTPQTVTVNAAPDDDGVIDNVVLQHTAAGGNYDSLTANLEVIVIDDDTAGISFNPATVTVNEEDNADYTVRLDTQPTADVIVGILSDNTEVTVVSLASLTFTPDNWSAPQTITVAAAHDDDAVDDSAILTHTATGGDYDSLTTNLEVICD